MSRDLQPYTELEHTRPQSQELWSLHNLQPADLAMIRELLAIERDALQRTLATLPHPERPSAIARAYQRRADRITHLLLHLYPKHH